MYRHGRIVHVINVPYVPIYFSWPQPVFKLILFNALSDFFIWVKVKLPDEQTK